MTLCIYLDFDVAVSGEVENRHGDECQINPKIIGKNDDKCVKIIMIILDLQRAPTLPTMGRIAKTIWRYDMNYGF